MKIKTTQTIMGHQNRYRESQENAQHSKFYSQIINESLEYSKWQCHLQ